MRIEKVNDNQIRCFLSREEMESRQLHLKELAYGTEKARQLFRDLMREAWSRFGFSADNMPVMIEAVPLHDDSLVLIVTRVDNPEELDTRFSSFAPSVKSGSDNADLTEPSPLGQLLDAIRREMGTESSSNGPSAKGSPSQEADAGSTSAKDEAGEDRAGKDLSGRGLPGGMDRTRHNSGQGRAGNPLPGDQGNLPGAGRNTGNIPVTGKTAPVSPAGQIQLYTFSSLSMIADAAAMAAPFFSGGSSLYRDAAEGRYYLFLTPAPDTDTVSFTRALAVFSEFGRSDHITPAREQYLREHCDVICVGDAVGRLARLARPED